MAWVERQIGDPICSRGNGTQNGFYLVGAISPDIGLEIAENSWQRLDGNHSFTMRICGRDEAEHAEIRAYIEKNKVMILALYGIRNESAISFNTQLEGPISRRI